MSCSVISSLLAISKSNSGLGGRSQRTANRCFWKQLSAKRSRAFARTTVAREVSVLTPGDVLAKEQIPIENAHLFDQHAFQKVAVVIKLRRPEVKLRAALEIEAAIKMLRAA